jgi:hypothetical protein
VRHPLDSARDKLIRADEHLDALEAKARAWLNSQPYSFYPVEADSWRHLRKFELHVEVVQPPPWDLGVLFGDTLHNLRGVLDHLFWELVCRRGNPDPPTWEQARTISFPIAKSYANFIDRPGIKSFRPRPKGQPRKTWRTDPPGRNRVTYAERLAIQRHQPYHRKDPATHPLAILRTLNDRDKHQTVHPLLVSVEEPAPKFIPIDGVIERTDYFSGEPLIEGAHIADLWFGKRGLNVNVDVEFVPVAVAFGRPPEQIPLQGIPALRHEVASVLADFVWAFSP